MPATAAIRGKTRGISHASVKVSSRSVGLRRGLEILSLFSDAKPEWGVTEVARELGLHKSRVHRAIKTLEDMGYLRSNPATRRYCMGFKAFEIGALAGRLTNRMAWARPDLRLLAHKLRATVSLRLVDDDDLLVVDIIESLDDPSAHMPQGARVTLNYGAGGQVLAAYRTDNEVGALIGRHGLPRYTAKSLTKESAFLKAIRRVRRQGYAISVGQTVPGAFGAAAPIVDSDGKLVAVLVATRSSKGMSRRAIKRFALTVAEKAKLLSR